MWQFEFNYKVAGTKVESIVLSDTVSFPKSVAFPRMNFRSPPPPVLAGELLVNAGVNKLVIKLTSAWKILPKIPLKLNNDVDEFCPETRVPRSSINVQRIIRFILFLHRRPSI